MKQLTTAAISDVSVAAKRFQALAELAIAKSKLCGSVCPVLGCCTKNGRNTLVMQLQNHSLQDLLLNAPSLLKPLQLHILYTPNKYF